MYARLMIVWIGLLATGGIGYGQELIKPPEVEKPAPDFKVTPVGGDRKEPITLADFKGQTLILEFWATWCGPCHQAREELTLLHKEFADRGLRILAVSMEQPEVVEKFIQKHPVPYQVAVDPLRAISLKYPCGGIPTSYIIDSKGLVRAFGNTPPRNYIAQLLSQRTDPPRATVTTQPVKRHERPCLKIEISQTSRRPKFPGNFGWSVGGRELGFQADQATLQAIISELLKVSMLRVQASDSAVFDSRWDIDFRHHPQNGRPDLALLIDALCREANVTINEVSEEREAWVARHKGDAPPKGEGYGYVWDQVKKSGTHLNVSMAELFRVSEEVIGVPIVDETNLTGRYRLELPAAKNFEETRAALETKYGISFTKERRKVPVYRVTPIGETRRAE